MATDHLDVPSTRTRVATSVADVPPLHASPPVERRRRPAGRRTADRRTNVGPGRTGAQIVELPRVTDPRGNLTFVEAGVQVPFAFERVYYLYDVPGGESRGGHGHRELHQLVVAASGSFEVLIDDGTHRERFFLNRSYYGLHIPPMHWRELDEFSSGSVCLVMASAHYDEADYFRDYDEFLAAARRR